jgi:hypothetical protein
LLCENHRRGEELNHLARKSGGIVEISVNDATMLNKLSKVEGFVAMLEDFLRLWGAADSGYPPDRTVLGLPVIAQRQAGYPAMHLRQTILNLFVQDDWRVSPRLTINLSLRYEMRTSLQDVVKELTNLTWDTGVPMAYLSGQNGFPKGLAFTDKNNFAPRIGIAYSPGEGKWVFRAGYGTFYSYPDMNLWCNQVHNVPHVFPEGAQSDNFIPSITRIGFNPPVLGQTRTAFTALDPHARTPYVQQASLTIERKLTDTTMLQVGYLGA